MKRTCKQCGKEFELSAGEIKFYEAKGLDLPKRCKDCRTVNKTDKAQGGKAGKTSTLGKTSKVTKTTKSDSENSTQTTPAPRRRETDVTGKSWSEAGWTPGKLAGTSIVAIAIVLAAIFGSCAFLGITPSFLPTGNNNATSLTNTSANGSNAANNNATASTNAASNSTTTNANTASNNTAASNTSAGNSSAASNSASTTNSSVASSTNASSLTFRTSSLLNEHYEKHGKDMGFASAKDYQAAAAAVVANPNALHKTEKEDGDDVYYVEATNDFVIVSTDGYIRTYFRPDTGITYYNKQ